MGEERAPFPLRLLRAYPSGSEEQFLNLDVLIAESRGLFLYVQFVHCTKMVLQSHLGVSRWGSNVIVLKKKMAGGGEE
jgi:hypothetical protein